MALPRVDEGGVAPLRGRPRLPPGVMEDDQYFVTTLFRVAQQLMSSEGVELAIPLSSEVSPCAVTCSIAGVAMDAHVSRTSLPGTRPGRQWRH